MAGKNPFEAMIGQGGGDEEFPPKKGKKSGGFMKAFKNAKKKSKKKGKK